MATAKNCKKHSQYFNEALTEVVPMKFNKGFAATMRNIVWMIPRMPPISKADEAEGIRLLLCSNSTILQSIAVKSEKGRV